MEDLNTIELSEQHNLVSQIKKPSPYEPKGFAGSVYSVLHDVVCILAVIVVSFVFAARLVGVSGSSMYPTLVGEESERYGTKGDYLVLRSNFLCSTYKQGDIVVACVPSFQDGEPIVKRVVAVGGQTVNFCSGDDGHYHLYVDGELQSEDQINGPMDAFFNLDDNFTATVPEGCYFLMGDNRNHSSDSRDSRIGMVDGRYIVGKALMVIFPGQDFQNANARNWKRLGSIYS